MSPRIIGCAVTALVAMSASSLLSQESVPAPAPLAPVPEKVTPFAAPAPPLTLPATAPAPPKPKLSPLSERPEWSKLAEFADTMSLEEFRAIVDQIYLEQPGAATPWTFTPVALSVETTAGQPRADIPLRAPGSPGNAAPRFWRTARELPPLKPDEPPLKGLHIALDPGHIGGSYAKMEERWLSMSPGTAIMEGELTLQVAQLLKPRLEALGARVSLVRGSETPVTTVKVEDLKKAAAELLKENGYPAPRETYEGLKGDAKITTIQWQAEKLFYRVSEIHARAKRVNVELKPDLVLCLHFNAEAWGDPLKPAPVTQDHFHLLVNGCYSSEELQTEDIRFDMLQRIFSRTHEEEKRLAESFAPAMAAATGLPAYVYTKPTARRIGSSPFIYARNLLANRLFQCPVIYLEPYVMNNGSTYKRLLLGPFAGRTLLDGKLVTSPQEDYTRGVVNALVTHAKKERSLAP